MEPVPAGAASAIALPRSTTAWMTCGASTDPAADSAAYSPTEWPAAATGSMPRGRSRVVSAAPTKHSAGCAFWVRRSSSSPAVVRSRRRSTPVADAHRSQSAEISSSSRSSVPMPGCCEPWPGNRNATFAAGLFLRLQDFAAGVLPAVRADRVRPARVLAVRARLDLDEREREVRAPPTLLRLGQLDLRESHGSGDST